MAAQPAAWRASPIGRCGYLPATQCRLPLQRRRACGAPAGPAQPPDALLLPATAPMVPCARQRRRCRAVRTAAQAPQSPSPAEPPKLSFLSSLYKSLRDFGIGRSSIAEGSLGLFLLVGGAAAVTVLAWVRGSALRSGRPYTATFEFPQACGITVGTPVRIRGVQIGSVLSVRPSLDRVDVFVEVADAASVIPRNSLLEANQSGLIAEPLVDITPQLPLPEYAAGPLDPECWEEGAIVCHTGHIKGQQGVALDDMVYVMTKMARQLDGEGLDKVLAAVEAASATLDEAAPLLQQATALLGEINPLLQELREGGLAAHLGDLTEAAASAASDLRALQEAVLTPENVKALRAAVLALCKTLEHVEAASGDAALFARDTGVQRNLKTLIQALSRIVEE